MINYIMLRKITYLTLLVALLGGCSSLSKEKRLDEGQQVSFGNGVQLLSTLADEVRETSGLAQSKGFLWTINDSGDGPYLYAVDKQFELQKKIFVSNAENIDWEELAQDEEYLYVADCGNNRGYRQKLQIYKVRWDQLERIDTSSGGSVTAETLTFEYKDRGKENGAKDHNYDCEAVASVGNELWVFTKNRRDQKTNLYRLNKHKTFQSVASSSVFDVGGLITAADYVRETNYLVLMGYEKNYIFGQSFIWLVPLIQDDPLQPDWSRAQYHKLSIYAQWEAILWDRFGAHIKLLLTSEKSPLLDVSIGEISVGLPGSASSMEK